MRRTIRHRFATLVFASLCAVGTAMAQAPSTEAPEPKMPPMPSMEGQQGDVSKPVTQIPPRKQKASGAAAVAARPRATAAGGRKPRPARSRPARFAGRRKR